MLSLAASSAGLPLDWLDRVALVEQPAVSHDVQKGFEQQFLAMQAATVAAIQAASLPLICTINTAGTAWLLLAFPGGTEADARRMFSVKDSDTGADGVLRIALAGPAYTGVAVLASCLLGCAPFHHVTGEQQDCVFWREAYTHIDPNEWSFGCFKTRDQLLPVFLILFDGRIASSSRNEGQGLKRQLCLLESRFMIQSGQLARLRQDAAKQITRVREAARSRQRRLQGKDVLAGHTRVEVAGRAQPQSSLLSIELADNEAEEENMNEELSQSLCGQKRTRGAGTSGEMGIESLWIKVDGPKKKRVEGGLQWNDRIVLCAALTRVLGKSSQAEAGLAGLDFLSRTALAVYAKAQPLGKYRSRKLPKNSPVPVLGKGISPGSLRHGVVALEFAKNDAVIDCIRDSHSLYRGYDSTTLASISLQIVSWRAIKIVRRNRDGAGTWNLGGDSRSGSFDLHALGGKRVTEHEILNDDGSKEVTSIEAAVRFAAQLQHGGAWVAAMGHPSLTTVSDGGTEAIGKGDRAAARLNMAGENSVVHRTFLLGKSWDEGMRLLNEVGLLVPLHEAYGYDPLNGDYSTRKPDGQRLNTIKKMLAEAMLENRKSAGTKSTADGTDSPPGSSEDGGDRVTLSDDENASLHDDDITSLHPQSRPIYDPLCGLPVPAVEPMSIIDFFAWDIAKAYPWLCLEESIADLTEDALKSVETFVEILINEACKVHHSNKCKVVSLSGFKSLCLNSFVSDEAINLVLENITHVLRGRFVSKGGTFTTGPLSPLIQSNTSISMDSDDATKALYVLDSVNAARLERDVRNTEKYAAGKEAFRADRKALKALEDMVSVLRSSESPNRRPTAAKKLSLNEALACLLSPIFLPTMSLQRWKTSVY